MTLTLYAEDRAQGASASKAPPKRVRLRAIARFKPFLVRRGPVKLKLRMPRRFRPTFLGLTVQEVVDAGTRPGIAGTTLGPAFAKKVVIGKPAGNVARVRDASRLHRVKPARRKGRRR